MDVRGQVFVCVCVCRSEPRGWSGGSEPLLGLAVRERQGALEVRCLAESGAAGAQVEIQSQYEQ